MAAQSKNDRHEVAKALVIGSLLVHRDRKGSHAALFLEKRIDVYSQYEVKLNTRYLPLRFLHDIYIYIYIYIYIHDLGER